jgi:GNAT superfamily N-acetyltransferase
MINYNLVRLSSDNIGFLNLLFQSVYRHKKPQNYFRLKYNTKYTGAEFIGFFAVEKGQPIAFYGIVPTLVSMGGKTVLAAQSCDTMTDPKYRRVGLFVELANATFELATRENIHFVFGFPNQNSRPGFIEKLGFVCNETMNRYSIKLRDNLYKKVFRRIVSHKNAGREILKNTYIEEGFDGVIYDSNYFKYKAYNPNFMITDEKYSCWLNNKKELLLGSIHIENSEELQNVIHRIDKKTKAKVIVFMTCPNTYLDRALKNFAPCERGFDIIIKDLTGLYSLDNLKFQFSDVDIF